MVFIYIVLIIIELIKIWFLHDPLLINNETDIIVISKIVQILKIYILLNMLCVPLLLL